MIKEINVYASNCSNNLIFFVDQQASIADWTTNRWATIFSDQAEKLLGLSSDEFGRAFDNNKDELEAMVSKVLFKSFIFKLRTKVENYGVWFYKTLRLCNELLLMRMHFLFQDSQRNKIQVMNISPISHKEYNASLIKNIQALTGIGKK